MQLQSGVQNRFAATFPPPQGAVAPRFGGWWKRDEQAGHGDSSAPSGDVVSITRSAPSQSATLKKLYSASKDSIAPLFIAATDKTMREASGKKDSKVLFIARDGIGGYQIAQELLRRFPDRYPGLTEDSLHYVCLNQDTIHSPLVKEYLQQETGLKKDTPVFLFDLGWYGSLNHSFANLFKGDLGDYQGLHLIIGPSESSTLHPFIKSGGSGSPFNSIPGNPAVHFMEDTYSGFESRANTFVRQDDGTVAPNNPPKGYDGETLEKRRTALKALKDASAEISLDDLNGLTSDGTRETLFDFMGDTANFKPLMVPHERS